MIEQLRIFVASAFLQLKTQRSALLVIIGVVQPAGFLGVALMAHRGGQNLDPAALALGLALVGLWGTTIWQTGNVLRAERWQGTLAPVLSRPAHLGVVLAGKAAASTLGSSLFVVPTVLITAALAGESVPARHPLALLAAALGVLVSASIFGMLVGCMFVLSRSAGRIAEAATYPIFILGGLVVPLSLLPHWVRPLADGVSLHWGAELLQAASAGTTQPGRAWLLLAVTTACYGAVAAALFGRMVDRGRRDGTLELF